MLAMPQSTVQLAPIIELIGKLWLHEVTSETLASMQSEEFRETYEQLGGFVPESIDAQAIENLAVEYCELLVGPRGHISPVQSVWSKNQFQSEASSTMQKFFDLLPGYQPESNLSDHIGVQLNYLGALFSRSDDAHANEVADHFVKTQLPWTSTFLDRVEQKSGSEETPSPFYNGLSKVTRALIGSL